MQKQLTKIIFFLMFISIFICNVIYQEFLYTNIKYKENLYTNKILKTNAENLSNDQLEQNSYIYLDKLLDIYIQEKDYNKALNIMEVKSKNNMTLTTIYSLINFSEETSNFDKAKEYLHKGFPLMDNTQKQGALLRLGEYELLNGNIDKSIEYTNQAKNINLLDKNSPEFDKNLSFINKRINLLNSIKQDFNSNDPYQAYKILIENDDIIYSPKVFEVLLEKYKKEDKSKNHSNYYSLKNIYSKIYNL